MSNIDLYDSEVAQIGPIWQRINEEFMTKTATNHSYDELQKRVHEEFFKIGLVARVEIPTYIVEGGDNEPVTSNPVIEIVGRVPGSKLATTEEGLQLFDHERKRHEVLISKERGEKYLGEKEKHPDLKKK